MRGAPLVQDRRYKVTRDGVRANPIRAGGESYTLPVGSVIQYAGRVSNYGDMAAYASAGQSWRRPQAPEAFTLMFGEAGFYGFYNLSVTKPQNYLEDVPEEFWENSPLPSRRQRLKSMKRRFQQGFI